MNSESLVIAAFIDVHQHPTLYFHYDTLIIHVILLYFLYKRTIQCYPDSLID